jgi:hypothetical protein
LLLLSRAPPCKAAERQQSQQTPKSLKRHQQGVFMDEAPLTMEKLSFEQAQAVDTISAYGGYLNRYPRKSKFFSVNMLHYEW